MFDKIDKALSRLEDGSMIFLMALAICLTFVQVVMRYVFNAPIYWAEEVVLYAIIVMSFVGISIGICKACVAAGEGVGLNRRVGADGHCIDGRCGVLHDDGDTEDLEEHEMKEARRMHDKQATPASMMDVAALPPSKPPLASSVCWSAGTSGTRKPRARWR